VEVDGEGKMRLRVSSEQICFRRARGVVVTAHADDEGGCTGDPISRTVSPKPEPARTIGAGVMRSRL
jgi:hypothetical protein